MRAPQDSPFSPGSDSVPQIWAGRRAQITDFRQVLRPRRLAGTPERGRIILGEPGSGKSSLTRRLAQEAAAAGAWTTGQIRATLDGDPLGRLATELLHLADRAGLPHARDRRIGSLLDRVESISLSGASLTIRPQHQDTDPSYALAQLLIEVGRQAQRAGDVLVLLHIDEIQNITDDATRSQLLIALGDALAHEEPAMIPGGVTVQRALPLAVYLSGLPDFLSLASASSGATFVRRFQTTALEGINDADLRDALRPFITTGWPVPDHEGSTTPIVMTPRAVELIVALACNEPFLFQLAGERAWFAGSGEVITEEEVLSGWEGARYEAELHATRLLNRLPERERAVLDAMSQIEPEQRSASQIAALMGYDTPARIGSALQRLDLERRIIARGRTYTFRNRMLEAYLTSDWPRAPR